MCVRPKSTFFTDLSISTFILSMSIVMFVAKLLQNTPILLMLALTTGIVWFTACWMSFWIFRNDSLPWLTSDTMLPFISIVMLCNADVTFGNCKKIAKSFNARSINFDWFEKKSSGEKIYRKRKKERLCLRMTHLMRKCRTVKDIDMRSVMLVSIQMDSPYWYVNGMLERERERERENETEKCIEMYQVCYKSSSSQTDRMQRVLSWK